MNHEDHIDFEKEVEEFTKFNFVKSIEILSKAEDSCEMLITTLEDFKLHLECSTSSGILVRPPPSPPSKNTSS